MSSLDLGRVRAAVVDLVVGDANTAAAAADALDAAGGAAAWDAALGFAVAWGALAGMRARLDRARLTPEARERLQSAQMALAVRSTFIVHRSAEVLTVLADAGIDAVAIKGVGLIAALRRNPASRATGDLDVVVRERDAQRARTLLIDRGFEEINPEFERHMSDIALSRRLHNFARALRRDEFEVDLHWRFGPNPPPALDTDRLLSRAFEAKLAGKPVRVADPIDAVLINVHHALRGSFVPHLTVRDLSDLKLWWEAGPVAERLDELIETAVASDLAPSLHALWGAILRRDPGHPLRAGHARLGAALSRSARSEAALLGRHFEDQLVHGVPARFTVEVFAPRVYARSVLGALVRAMRPGPGRAVPASAADAAGRGSPAARLARLGPRVARVLRDLARLRVISSYRALARSQSRFH